MNTLNHEAKFPSKPQNKLVWFAHNPECEADACWFSSEAQAFDHFCAFGKHYRYTVISEAERTCELLDCEFSERRDDTPHNRAASDADLRYQFVREAAI